MPTKTLATRISSFSPPLEAGRAPLMNQSGRRRKLQPEDLWVPFALALGIVLGLLLPSQDGTKVESHVVERISAVLGWTYFAAWTVSFYPQLFLNCQRRSVVGLSMEYQMFNLVGFSFYFAFNALLYWDPHVKQEYRQAHSGHDSAVRLNDVFFAGHAAVITGVTLLQIAWFYDYPPLDGPDKLLRWTVLCGLGAVCLAAVSAALLIAATQESTITWLTFLSILSEVKVVITLFKYTPQVWMNYRRKSTEGWVIHNVLLDLTGGSLSVAQLVLDAVATSDWGAITGDPAKFLLGNVSMVFDAIFLAQHYCWYRKKEPQVGTDSEDPDMWTCSSATAPVRPL